MAYNERPDLAASRAATMNEQFFPAGLRTTQSFGIKPIPIYVFNISSMGWESKDGLSRPPNHPHLTIKACPKDKLFILTGMLQHPFEQISYDQNNNRTVELVDGFREATVMLSPMNPSVDQDWRMDDAFNRGGNLNEYGVFWSTSNPPKDAELAAARKRLEDTYKEELRVMKEVEDKNPADASARSTKISHAAANYFGLSFSWHRSDLVPKEAGKQPCANCAEMISPSAAVCRFCGAVIDEKKARKLFPDRFKPAVEAA